VHAFARNGRHDAFVAPRSCLEVIQDAKAKVALVDGCGASALLTEIPDEVAEPEELEARGARGELAVEGDGGDDGAAEGAEFEVLVSRHRLRWHRLQAHAARLHVRVDQVLADVRAGHRWCLSRGFR